MKRRVIISDENLGEHFLRLPQEINQLLIDVIKAIFEAVLEQKGLHCDQRYPVQMCQDQVYSLESARAVRSELEEPFDDCRHIVIVLLH